ncbi:MAG TPA: C40 family peptidase [Bacteroidales bacterium]|nr:C40 family peptidase [Bacteroidales bacterium]
MGFILHKKFNLVIFLISISGFFILSCSTKLSPSNSNNMPGKPGRGFADSTIIKAKPVKVPEFKAGTVDIRKKDTTEITVANKILETAFRYIGVPHCMGGTTFKCIDCSGFVMKVFEENGINLPHNAQAQSKFGTVINKKEELEKGDLVFFKESYNTTYYITHSGIYIGENKFIHTSSGEGVTITSLDDRWWKNKFVFGTRILE